MSDPDRILILGGDFGKHVNVSLRCGRQLEFGLDYIQEDKRQWLCEVLQRQVNEIVAKERHAAVEAHKAQLNNLLAPQSFVDSQATISHTDIFEFLENQVATHETTRTCDTTWKLGDKEITGHSFKQALRYAIQKFRSR